MGVVWYKMNSENSTSTIRNCSPKIPKIEKVAPKRIRQFENHGLEENKESKLENFQV
jgi:hypothetical protein